MSLLAGNLSKVEHNNQVPLANFMESTPVAALPIQPQTYSEVFIIQNDQYTIWKCEFPTL
ncbi:hypothetical protein FRX31_011894 [Thalictrum thalictroides]|uniref:Uncharacterized protein n=1 Tax=Thalictrum thalictroides TaxID=46969 RepID=A0A7J6WPL9_THATH|nr:hypothetical protein FRX31_011894 [Thalictrum thalictroides]